ncbi:hypothetical protein CEUSTIGMA_g3697.t1 [Chlamydomonas eustigma]|uniref:RAP domain-containing protein n=1 Tax=Chlamydomonas eustigma TaxID=1157962 RepID=A0A250WZH9_9CHLO|nr:hypothetical protein CEUSTIGMA_g3697.t1 [Chlamydomonas eustigma]|eukprot:GAX76253.1 hypothetical protein CEUSTIGMA_g3697.t1 [Chlamydomonas eustigma]
MLQSYNINAQHVLRMCNRLQLYVGPRTNYCLATNSKVVNNNVCSMSTAIFCAQVIMEQPHARKRTYLPATYILPSSLHLVERTPKNRSLFFRQLSLSVHQFSFSSIMTAAEHAPDLLAAVLDSNTHPEVWRKLLKLGNQGLLHKSKTPGEAGELVEVLHGLVSSRLHELNGMAGELVEVLHHGLVSSRLHELNGMAGELVEVLHGLVSSRLHELNGSQMCCVMWALACLGDSNGGSYLESDVMQGLYGKLSTLSCEDLIKLIWSLSVSGNYNQELFASLTDFIMERCLPDASPSQLAIIAASFASFSHFEDDQDFFDAIARSFIRQIHSASLSDIVLAMKSFAVLQYQAVMDENSTTFFQAACSHLSESQGVSAMSIADLSDLLWSCAWINFKDDALIKASRARLKSCFPRQQDHASVAGEGDVNKRVFGAWAGKRKRQVVEGNVSMPPQQSREVHPSADRGSTRDSEGKQMSANIMHGTAGISQNMSFKMAETWSTSCKAAGGLLNRASVQHNPALQPRHAENRLPDAGLKRAGDVDDSDEATWAGADGKVLMSPETITKVLWSMVVLEVWEPGLFQDLLDALRKLQPDDLNSVQAARLGAVDAGMSELIPGSVPAPSAIEKSPTDDTCFEKRWRDATLPRVASLRLPDVLLPQILVESKIAEDREDDLKNYQSWKYRSNYQEMTRSAIRHSIVQTLHELGDAPPPRGWHCTIDGYLTPHIATSFRGHRLAIEIIDPSCCLRSEPQHVIGAVSLRQKCLLFRGWRVLQVPFHEWCTLPDATARQRFLMQKVAESSPVRKKVMFSGN